jgi:very-short-patch-repair endonuclease
MPSGIYIRTKPTWNKGLTKEIDNRVMKYSNTKKNYKSPFKGMTNEGIYGQEKSKIISEKIRFSKLGDKNPTKREDIRNKMRISHIGLIFTKSHRDNISRSLKGKNKGEKNGMFGKPSWNLGKKSSLETRNKLKIHRSNQIFPVKDTLIEVKIREFLDSLKIEYFQHKYMNISHAYQCDFFIPSMNLVIECDGDYWHKYPTGNDIDHIRTSELIEKGFKVLRLWEFEIKKMNIDKFKRRLE